MLEMEANERRLETTRPTAGSEALPTLVMELNVAYARMLVGHGARATEQLIEKLDEALPQMARAERAAAIASCREHPIFDLLMQDPYTARGFRKPRGSAGDAVMLDWVYDAIPAGGTSPIGRDVFGVTTRSSAASSVAGRARLLGRYIEQTVRTTPSARIASIACGHLRELDAADGSVPMDRIEAFFAIDADEAALERIRGQHGDAITCVRESVGGILKGRLELAKLDLVYAAGVFEYLDDFTAARLVSAMVAALRPGGRVLIANFTPTHKGRGYMEAFMDWRLVCRDRQALIALSSRVGPSEASLLCWEDSERNVAYLEIRKP